MGRIAFRDFEERGEEVARVYIAASLDESSRVEEALGGAGILYAVELEPYATMSVLGIAGRVTGAAFYVLERDAQAAAGALQAAGLGAGLLLEAER
jgi:hypothetical protein